jgi:hypothetical protein
MLKVGRTLEIPIDRESTTYLYLPFLGAAWIALSICVTVFFGSNVIADGHFSTEFQMFRQTAVQTAVLVMPFAAWSAMREPVKPILCSLFFSIPGVVVAILVIGLSMRLPTPINVVWLPTITMVAPLLFPPAIFIIFAWTRRSFIPITSWLLGALGVAVAFTLVQLLVGIYVSQYEQALGV